MSPQSSLYSDEGLGVTVLSTLYGGVLLSSMLLPPLLIRALGCKWTIVLSMGCYVAFSLGNFYASWYHGPPVLPTQRHTPCMARVRLRPLPPPGPLCPSCGLGGPPSERGLSGTNDDRESKCPGRFRGDSAEQTLTLGTDSGRGPLSTPAP